ncbi:asparagine synthase (glutamine-hydrolyzing) [Streptomyces sp. P5-A9]|uniref:asparagine synthase (glutamine-hydrolyzing) n=2 Tax=unclassified Streptomyces TaxID=2593676 RepID=UPI003FCC9098
MTALCEALAHRGPDGSAVEVIGNVGLVHTRLAIMDVSEQARQPKCDKSSGWWLSFNGEVYNHEVLRKEFSGPPLMSSGDTETLLRSLAEWGPQAVERFNGQFAFAALDTRGGRLWLSRDRFGIKPLYLAFTEEGLWFASEPMALRAAGVPMHWATGGWRSVREGSCYSGETTLIEGIHRLPPGMWASVDVDTCRLTSERWAATAELVRPRPGGYPGTRSDQVGGGRTAPAIGGSAGDGRMSPGRRVLARRLEDALREAVHTAMLSDVPVGVLCSGGVDSSLIAALAAEVRPGLIALGASCRARPDMDEGSAARRAAAALGIELDLVEITPQAWRSAFVPTTVHFGAPLHDPSPVSVGLLAARARELDLKVVLTGEGADELFAGYGSLHSRELSAVLSPSARLVRALEPHMALASRDRRSGPAYGHHTLQAALPMRRMLVHADAARRKEEAWAAYQHHEGPRRALEASLLAGMDTSLCTLLNRMDTSMMMHGVEARVPFLDPALVAVVLNLPLETRVGPWSKGILRDVARRLMPWWVAHRPKIGGLAYQAFDWIREAADPRFLTDGVLRETLGLNRRDFEDQLGSETVRSVTGVRIWSAEVWSRAMLAGQPVAAIEADLWRSSADRER